MQYPPEPQHHPSSTARWICSLLFASLPVTFAPLASSASLQSDAPTKNPKPPIAIQSPAAKPNWLTDLSLGTKESYDSNVYASGTPSSYPLDGASPLKNRASWVTTISPKAGIDFAPLLGTESFFKTLALGYASEFAFYHNEPSENYNAHRVSTVIKGKTGPLTLSLDNLFAGIDGSHVSPIYPGGYANCYGIAFIRERRSQIQDRAKLSLRIDAGKFFLRPTASLLFYNLNTQFENVKGYQNWVDRYDFGGGVDLGFQWTPDLALTLGYRYGHQFQQSLPWDTTDSTNNYQRVLLGVEGKPIKWLKIEAVAGPDFKSYGDDAPLALTDQTPRKIYAEASLTITPADSDSFSLKYKIWDWVSSTGKVPYTDICYELSYHHRFNQAFQLDLSARVGESDYNPAATRNDLLLAVAASLRYQISQHIAADLSYSIDQGGNAQDAIPGVVNPIGRDFTRQIASVGLQWSF